MMPFKDVRPGMVLRQEHDDSRTIYVLKKDKERAWIFFLTYNKEDGYWLYRETVPKKNWNEWNKIYNNTDDYSEANFHGWLVSKIFAKDFAVRDSKI
jgi:hypothetical protein